MDTWLVEPWRTRLRTFLWAGILSLFAIDQYLGIQQQLLCYYNLYYINHLKSIRNRILILSFTNPSIVWHFKISSLIRYCRNVAGSVRLILNNFSLLPCLYRVSTVRPFKIDFTVWVHLDSEWKLVLSNESYNQLFF